MKITSFQNPHIKRVLGLKERKHRRQEDLTIVDGIREVTQAWEGGVVFFEIFICPDLLQGQGHMGVLTQAKSCNIPVYEIPVSLYAKVCFGARKDGIVAICRPKVLSLQDVKIIPSGLWVVLENLEKPGNLGAILRTCDAVGVQTVFVSDLSTDIYNPNVIRSSLGTIFSVPVVRVDQKQLLDFLKLNKISIMAATPQGAQTYTEIDFTKAITVVLGSEEKGLSDFWLKAADNLVSIPMLGKADSLNVSVSAAIFLYEALRQRSGPNLVK